ncbi:MAG TPA: recombinase family protein, partial [Symbiobacteriaceae bacterium]|nr:recombinase family protein [Symbiobacteriaceae bacterium]
MDPNKVAIYIRWSTEDQGEGTTLDVQLDACRAYMVSQGWSFREDLVYVDDGVSGATMERPALGRLRGTVARGLVECVVVYKLDRLSRSVLDMLKLVLEEWDGRCHVKSAREPIDTLTPTGKMFFYQLMSFAEWERSVIRDRMHSGRVRRAQQGRSPGAPLPHGYIKQADGAIAIDEAAAMAVRRIFRLYLSGLG